MQFKQEQMEFINQLLYPILILKKDRDEERPSSPLEEQLEVIVEEMRHMSVPLEPYKDNILYFYKDDALRMFFVNVKNVLRYHSFEEYAEVLHSMDESQIKQQLMTNIVKQDEEEVEVEKIKAAIEEQAREDEQPQSSNFTLRKILGGDILSTRLLRNNIWLIITAVIFTIVYISNRYSVQKYLIEIDKLQKELEDAKYRALSSSSQLTEKTRESHILEILKTRKDSVLKMSDRPPYIIDVPEK